MTLQAKANRTNESKKIYLVQGNCPRISSVSDKNNWKAVMKALPVIGFTEEEVQVIFRNLTSATLQAVVISHCSCSPSSPLKSFAVFPPTRTCSTSWAASSILETLSLEKERREKLISPPSLRSTILRRSEQSCLYFWVYKYAPNPGRRCSQEQMCCCFPAAGC